MLELLAKAFTPVVLVYLVSTMLASGLSLTPAQIFGPFRKVRLTVSAALGGFVLVPLIAALVARAFGIDPSLRYGMVLLAMCAGAESVPLLTTNAKGNIGVAVGLLVTSLLLDVFYLPAMLSIFLEDVSIDRVGLLVKLSLTVALPIAIGLVVKARHDKVATSLAHWAHKCSSLFMLLTVVLIFALNYEKLLALFGTKAIAAALVYILASFVAGYALGGPARETRVPMAFWLGARNASIPMLLATQLFPDDPKVLVMVSVTVMLMVVLALPTSYWLGSRDTAQQQPAIQG